MIHKLGAQLYTVREALSDEASVAASFARLKAIGYDEIQTAGLCGLSADTFARLANDAGLTVCGTFCPFDEIIADVDGTLADHEALGTKNIGISHMPEAYRHDRAGLEDFLDKAARFAEEISRHGYRFNYHNHAFEFCKFDGVRIFDRMIEALDPAHTTFVLDTYWVQYGGGDVIDWMKKLAGRIDILHLKDMAMADKPYFTEIGNGNLNFEGILKTADEIGVKHYVVEQDTCPGDPFDSLSSSARWLKQNFMQ